VGQSLRGILWVEVLNVGQSVADLPAKVFSIRPVKTEDSDITDPFPSDLARLGTIHKKPICTGNALAEWVMVLIFSLLNTA
jgi:hypothetical protein